MGLMDKFKNLFTEEVEEVKPIKKEVRHVEITSPKRSEIKKSEPVVEEDSISDSTAITREEKFVFPVYFDDKDFDDLEKPKKVEEKKTVKESKPVAYKGAKIQTEVEEKKVFKPSPIISPVYGILDKNYHKDDIVTKTPRRNDYRRVSGKVTVDDIRDKAFGTLEDDLKNSLLNTDYEEKYEPDDDMLDMFNDLDFDKVNNKRYIEDDEDSIKDDSNYDIDGSSNLESKDISNNDLEIDDDEDTIILARQLEEQKKKLEELNDFINENEEEIPENIDSLIDDLDDEDNKIEEIDFDEEEKEEKSSEEEIAEENTDEDLTQSELLNLIDSMYDNKEE